MKRFRRTALVLFMGLSLASAFTQSRHGSPRHQTPEPALLSKWIRHVGLHYFELIDDYLVGKNSDDLDRSDKFLDAEEKDVSIDADGPDRVFVETVLKQVRRLSLAEYFNDGGHCSIGRVECAGFAVEAHYYSGCRAIAEEMVSDGQLRAFEMCSYGVIHPLAARAEEAEEEKVRQIVQGWAKDNHVSPAPSKN